VFFRSAIVEPKYLLIDIHSEMKRFNRNVGSPQRSFEERPEIVQTTYVDAATHVSLSLINHIMPPPPDAEGGALLIFPDTAVTRPFRLASVCGQPGQPIPPHADGATVLDDNFFFSNETSCAGGAPLGMKMGFHGEDFERRSVSVVQAFVVSDCLKVVLTTL